MREIINAHKYVCLYFFLMAFSSNLFAGGCDGCWEPKLNFDIEGKGFIQSMIFISGYSYSLSMINDELNIQGKENFFCKKGSVGSKELIDILNKKISGIVTPEEVTREIRIGLKEYYPCE